MAEHSFQEVMKQFDRMCWHYQQKRECPMACPMNGVNISQCRKIAFEEPKVTEQTVMQWAEENPEPVYPTWVEWLLEQGVASKRRGFRFEEDGMYEYCLTAYAFKPMPADIAQKLGIPPKEG